MSERGWIEEAADLFDGGALEDPLDGTGGGGRAETFLSLGPLLAAARRPPSGAELAGEAEAVAAYRRLRTLPVAASGGRRPRRRGLKLIAVAGAITVTSATGAAAATGGLPGPVQDTAATLLATVGISVPEGGGVPAGPPVPSPAATTAASAPAETSTTTTGVDTTVEAEVAAPIGTDVTTAASLAPAPAPADPGPPGPAKVGKGGPDQADDPAPAHDDNRGEADDHQAEHPPGGPVGKDQEPGTDVAKPLRPKAPKPPKPPNEKAAPAAGS
jgi:hypothetical protein